MFGFAWNTKKVKTIVSSPEGRVQVEVTAGDVVRTPNRHQIETIISSLCTCVSELMSIQEAQAKRIADLQGQLAKKEEGTTNEAVQI
jgi:hypothetical protein